MSLTLHQPQHISPEAWANTWTWKETRSGTENKRTKDVLAGDTTIGCKIRVRIPKYHGLTTGNQRKSEFSFWLVETFLFFPILSYIRD